MSEELKSSQIVYGENVLMMRVDDCLIFGNKDALRRLAEKLKELPSAEPKRKKGEWVDGLPYVNSHWWVCSICHVSAPENHTGYNFCPNCGAEMSRGE